MLRRIRISLAVAFFLLLTMLFLDFTGTFHKYFAWIAKIQFIPAVLAVNGLIVIILLLLTFLFGRVYCSIICPLGVWQDLVSWFSKHRKKVKHKPFHYSQSLTWLRVAFLIVFVVLLAAGFTQYAGLIEPYSAFGKISSNIFSPVYRLINNVLAFFAEKFNSYAFYSTDVVIKSVSILIISIVTFLFVSILAWQRGRIYCNSICPVGTVLGFVAKFSVFKPAINLKKCNSCGVCARKCKSQCINSKEHKIDYSRCVACFDCMEECSQKAMKYSPKFISNNNSSKFQNTENKEIDVSKRNFLTVSALTVTTAALKAQQNAVDGGLAVIENKKIPKRHTPILPPNSENQKHFYKHCTACQLCITACPNNVLQPTTSIEHFMQPQMQYENGYCRPECVRCTEVCPTQAIKRISVEQKSSLKRGTARWIRENCVVIADGVNCSNCERHCPVGAIARVPLDINDEDSLKIPVVDVERCIGCGACENLCPARPFSAMYVEGIETQRFI
ncbi:MAG: 4Fe-4S dicluster domain-containing protein [Paludibacter sp.]|nr:4Fe-4S dicluster domain-containing protein [Paludibacter sp.]